jgi:hypothetical protein
LIKESADLWRKHGAQVSVWSVQVGEVGNMVFACRFDSSAQLGATLDAVNADPGLCRLASEKHQGGTCVLGSEQPGLRDSHLMHPL